MDTPTIVAVVIGVLGLLFGIYSHFSTRKVAKLTYEVSQLSDFDVPPSFLQDMPRAPVAVTITSRGNKGTENIVLNMKMNSDLESYEVSPTGAEVSLNGAKLSLHVSRLNPSQTIKLFLRCAGSPSENQIESLDLSHSEGAGKDEREITSFVFNFAGLELEYDPRELRVRVNRIGPLRIR